MSERKQLTVEQTIRMLTNINRSWPDGLSLFANKGTLMLIDENDNRRVVWTFDSITCDGGDLTLVADEEGNEYLNNEEARAHDLGFLVGAVDHRRKAKGG